MRQKNSDFKVNFTSETGSLAKNNSLFDFVELDNYACWIAVDVNEDGDKEIAVMIAQSILSDFKRKPSITKRDICKYIINARDLVMDRIAWSSTKVSLAIAATDYSKAFCIATGTERLYYIESVEQVMVEPEAVLVLGVDEKTENRTLYNGENDSIFGMFVSKTIKLKDGDVILFGNSGFWKNINLKNIINKLYGAKEPYMFLYNLKSVLLANQEQSLLSYTIAAIFAYRVSRTNTSKYMKALASVMGVILLLAGFWVFDPLDLLKNIKPGMTGNQSELAENLSQTTETGTEYVTYEQNGDGLVREEKYSQALEEYNKAIEWVPSKDLTSSKALQQKIDLTQLILDADRLAGLEQYSAALEAYGKAKELVAKVENYDRRGLQKKFAKTQAIQTVLELLAKGDKQVNRKKYEAALKDYQDAQSLARDIAYDTTKTGLENKIKQLERKIREEQAKQQLAALPGEKEESEKLQHPAKSPAEKMRQENARSQQPEKTPELAKTGWRAYDYTAKVEPPPGFAEGNIKNRMEDYCMVNDGALIMDTMAKPAAGPAYKMEIRFTKQVGFGFTVVARAKAASQFGMDFDFRAVGFRERIRLLNNSIKFEVSSIEKVFKTSDWHTYWMTFEIIDEGGIPKLVTKVFVDGAATPVIQGTSIAPDSNSYFRFGDCSSSSGYVGAVDWIAWNFDGAYDPTQIRLPAGLRMK